MKGTEHVILKLAQTLVDRNLVMSFHLRNSKGKLSDFSWPETERLKQWFSKKFPLYFVGFLKKNAYSLVIL